MSSIYSNFPVTQSSNSTFFSISISQPHSSTFPRSLPITPQPWAVQVSNRVPTLNQKLISLRPGVLLVDDRKTAETEQKEEEEYRTPPMTKLVCTIGPDTCEFEQLEAFAAGGMSVARLNMCHGTREWHRAVVERVRRLNQEKGYSVAILMETEGSEIHMGDFGGQTSAKAEDGDMWTFTVRALEFPYPKRTVNVSYDGFAEDVKVGDELVVDGGMVRFEVIEKIGPDVLCRCIDSGLLLPRANLNFWRDGSLVRERNAMLPTLLSKDWLDIDFGIEEGVDFIGVSFVKSADVITHLKSYIASRNRKSEVAVIAKIESIDSLDNLQDIVMASDGVMVARGDLGAQIPLEQVPSVQKMIVQLCRKLNKPVIVASQLLESMIEYPIPTRAEVADVSEAVGQQADALMLSGESAMGNYPEKALSVLRNVSLRIERHLREEKHRDIVELLSTTSPLTTDISDKLCNAAAKMAEQLKADFIFVYTNTGKMASLMSGCRPNCPIFAFTPSESTRRCLNLQWGVIPFHFGFTGDMENNLSRSFSFLKARGLIKPQDLVIVVSDMLQSVQVINVS